MKKPSFKIKPHAGGGFYWVFVGANGEPMCHSESYTTLPHARRSVMRMKQIVSGAEVRTEIATLLNPPEEITVLYPFKLTA